MATDGDDAIALPTPPPPRPAARRDAIEVALRKFDGVEETAGQPPARSWWASHQRQLGALATVAVIAVVSIPVALSVLNEQPKPVAQRAPAPAAIQSREAAPAMGVTPEPQPARNDQAATAEVPRSRLPLEPHDEPARSPAASEEQKAANQSAALAVAAPPPPAAAPAPPPPPAPERDQAVDEGATQDIVLTGSRIRQAEPSTQHGRLAAKRAEEAASPAPTIDLYRKFLSRLQAAIRSNDRRAVSGLVAFPLRVSASDGPRTYPNRKSVEQDFDRIFTPRVRKAILDQRADRLFTNYQGAMVGDGEVWFDQTCRNASCSIRIKAVNP